MDLFAPAGVGVRMTKAFDLRALINLVSDETQIADPGTLADIVLARITPKDRNAALSQSLRPFVRQIQGEARMRVSMIVPTEAEPSSSTPARGSAKVAGIRDEWQRALSLSVFVGAEGYKLLGDCGHADLLFAASQRFDMAARNMAKGTQFERLAASVLESGVERLRDLPVEMLASLGRVA